MTRTILAVAAVMAMTACAGSENDCPDVEALYSVDGQSVSCSGTVSQRGEPEAGPFTEYECAWEYVRLDGRPRCYVVASFTRPDAAADWSVSVFGSAASCD